MINDIDRELAWRESARRHPQHYAQYVDPNYMIPYGYPHTAYLFDKYHKAETGELWANMRGSGPRILLISLPPGHLKTSSFNKHIGYFIGRRKQAGQHHQVIMTSYGATLAETNSRSVMADVSSHLYGNVFKDVAISKDLHSVGRWALAGEKLPTVLAVGVGGAATGQRADLFGIDDPHKDAAEANSPSIREDRWQWFVSVCLTRLRDRDKSYVVIPHTRWHEDDLTGRILRYSQQNPGAWRVVLARLPALAETQAERQQAYEMGLPLEFEDPLGRKPGEALCPEIMTREQLLAQQSISPGLFDALYQGRPRRVGGNLIGRHHFKVIPTKPTGNIRWCIPVDWAYTAKQVSPNKRQHDPDYTVVSLMGLWQMEGAPRHEWRIVIANMKYIQASLRDAKAMVKQFALLVPGVPIVSFRDSIDRVALEDLMADPELYGHRIRLIQRPRGDKLTLAQPWLDRAEGGLVYVVGGSWNSWFFNQVEAFPHGTHDDGVDNVSVGFNYFGFGKKQITQIAKPMGWFN